MECHRTEHIRSYLVDEPIKHIDNSFEREDVNTSPIWLTLETNRLSMLHG